jgi:hypothetical protein
MISEKLLEKPAGLTATADFFINPMVTAHAMAWLS